MVDLPDYECGVTCGSLHGNPCPCEDAFDRRRREAKQAENERMAARLLAQADAAIIAADRRIQLARRWYLTPVPDTLFDCKKYAP